MPELGIVVPFCNEEGTAGTVARGLLDALGTSGLDFEMALVADGSTDGTRAELVAAARGDPRVRIVCGPDAEGYGTAVLHGFSLLSADVVGWTDGDGQVPPEAIVDLYRAMRARGASVAVAQRSGRQDGWVRAALSRGYNWTVRLALGFRIPDVNAKPKLIHRALLAHIAPRSSDWFIDTEIVAGARARGADVLRVPVPFLARPRGATKVRASVVSEYVRNLLAYRRRLRAERPAPYVSGPSPSGTAGEAARLADET